jgi:hypothetical protein
MLLTEQSEEFLHMVREHEFVANLLQLIDVSTLLNYLISTRAMYSLFLGAASSNQQYITSNHAL